MNASDDCLRMSSTWLSDESDLFLLVVDDDQGLSLGRPWRDEFAGCRCGCAGPDVAGRELTGVCCPQVLFMSLYHPRYI